MSIKNLLTENQKKYLDLNIDTLNTNTINSENLYLQFSTIIQDYLLNPIITSITTISFVVLNNFPSIPANSFQDITFNLIDIREQISNIFVKMNNLSNDENSKCVIQVQSIISGSCQLRIRNLTNSIANINNLSFMILILSMD